MSKSPPKGGRFGGSPKASRSRITNGSAWLPNTDGRSAAARRYRDLVVQFADDLGGGDQLSTAETSIVKLAASLVVQSEDQAARIVNGEAVDPDASVRLANVANRLLKTLIEKRNVKREAARPDLDAYLAGEDTR